MAKTPKIRFKNFSDEWENNNLGEICKIIKGEQINKLSLLENGKYYVLNGGISPSGYINTYNTLENTISISEGGNSCGYVKFNIEKFWSGGHNYTLNELKTKTLFLYSFLKAKQQKIMALRVGSGLPNIQKNTLSNISISIPNSEEQEKIGAFFSKLDKLITLHQSKFEKLQKIKKSCLQNLFPKNNQNTPKIRFKNFTDEWVENRLGGIANIINRKDENSTAPVMMISASSGFINQSIKYSTDNAGQSLAKYIILKKHELAYNHGASKYRPYGSCFELQVNEARIPFVYHCFKLINDNSTFMALQLNNPNIDKQLRKLVSSGARMDGLLNISYEDYMSIEILIPNLEEQEKIGAFFSKLDKLITLHQSKFKKLQKIKKSCLQNMFV